MRHLFLLTLLFTGAAKAQIWKSANDSPLFFPAERNHVEVLAQHFLYEQISGDQMRIGDLLIDSSKLRMSITRSGEARLIFQWPAALAPTGRISLVGNSGRALWTTQVASHKGQLVRQDPPADHKDLRADLTRYTSTEIPQEVLDQMRQSSFVTFCISNESPLSKLYLCSSEFYLVAGKDGARTLQTRFTGARGTSVEINGKAVTPQGLVYLNDKTQSLFMRAQFASGASIEILTRRRDVDFKDVLISEDGKRLLVTAEGAEAAQSEGLVKGPKGQYQISLPIDRPSYFLLGEGGIPMRQEFLAKPPLPKEQDRATVRGQKTKIFSSSLSLRGFTAPGSVAASSGGDSNLEMRDGNEFSWSLNNIEAGKSQRRYLSLTRAGQTFTAAYDVQRGLANEIEARGFLHLTQMNYRGELIYRRWFEDLFFISSSLTSFHWGASLFLRQHLRTVTDVPDIDFTGAELLYRFNPSFNFEKDTWTFGLIYAPTTINQDKSTSIGLDLTYGMHLPEESWMWLKPWVNWLEFSGRLWPTASGDNAKLATSWELNTQGTHFWGSSAYTRAGAGLSQYKTTLALPKESVQLDLMTSVGLQF